LEVSKKKKKCWLEKEGAGGMGEGRRAGKGRREEGRGHSDRRAGAEGRRQEGAKHTVEGRINETTKDGISLRSPIKNFLAERIIHESGKLSGLPDCFRDFLEEFWKNEWDS
jgi:hypothetical protein